MIDRHLELWFPPNSLLRTCLMETQEKFCTCIHWIFTKICLEIRDKLWVTPAWSFSLTFPDSRQIMLKLPDFPEGKKIPHFPWWWEPLLSTCFGKAMRSIIKRRSSVSARQHRLVMVILCSTLKGNCHLLHSANRAPNIDNYALNIWPLTVTSDIDSDLWPWR